MAKKAEADSGGLARSLSPPLLILVALGTTLGAGIYVVIGEIIGAAGYWAPVSFLAACVVAGFTGASFAELSGRIPSSGGPVAWADAAFGRRWLAIGVGWAIILTGIASGATVSTGFVSYVGEFVDWPKWWVLPVLVGIPTLIAVIGVKQSAWFMGATTIAGIVGLLIVLWQAGGNIPEWPQLLQRPETQFGKGGIVMGVMLGAFLAFYAFIGFEDIAHLGEETKIAHRTVPIAIFVTLGVALIFYFLISVTAVSTLPPERLAQSKVPLVDVVEAAGFNGLVIGVLGLVTIADGLFAQIIMVSRTIYDLGRSRGGAPKTLAALSSRTRTPVLATILVGGAILLLALFFPTRTLAAGTSSIVLAVFTIANVSLIRLKAKGEAKKDVFQVPVLVPWIGAATCLLLLAVQPFVGGG